MSLELSQRLEMVQVLNIFVDDAFICVKSLKSKFSAIHIKES